MIISGNVIDIRNKRIYPGEIETDGTFIKRISEKEHAANQYLLPGFVDSHVHIESSMLVPSEFARLAVVHGTVATVSDPHEIANVLGVKGVDYMISNGKQVSFKFYFGAPSCVPATAFETAGATIGVQDIEALLQRDEIRYLAEMMNWPGVLQGDAAVKAKIQLAARFNKVVDGHAPGLKGEQAQRYIAAGISTDHECFTEEEALDKLRYGMKILIREGSAARNFEALINLLHRYEDDIMFCSDDKHPDSLEEGHINLLVKRALAKGIDLFKVLKAACVNPVAHYKLDVGTLRAGEPADFIIIDNPESFNVQATYIQGEQVAADGKTLMARVKSSVINNFNTQQKQVADFALRGNPEKIRVIEALDGQLITPERVFTPRVIEGAVVQDTERDLLKIAVVNRYKNADPSVAFVKGFNLKKGAIASSVAHDSHNIIVVGVDDESMARAVNSIIDARGGVSAVGEKEQMIIPLPVAGIMSVEDGYVIARQYKQMDALAKSMGSTLQSPYMTLSFMALLVIPTLKLSDKGLFNGVDFEFVQVGM